MIIDVAHMQSEVDRLERMGVLEVTHKSAAGKPKTAKLVVLGHGVSGRERDFILFAGPHGMRHKHTLRAIEVQDIIEIKAAENQSFDRHAVRETQRNLAPPTIHLIPRL